MLKMTKEPVFVSTSTYNKVFLEVIFRLTEKLNNYKLEYDA